MNINVYFLLPVLTCGIIIRTRKPNTSWTMTFSTVIKMLKVMNTCGYFHSNREHKLQSLHVCTLDRTLVKYVFTSTAPSGRHQEVLATSWNSSSIYLHLWNWWTKGLKVAHVNPTVPRRWYAECGQSSVILNHERISLSDEDCFKHTYRQTDERRAPQYIYISKMPVLCLKTKKKK